MKVHLHNTKLKNHCRSCSKGLYSYYAKMISFENENILFYKLFDISIFKYLLSINCNFGDSTLYIQLHLRGTVLVSTIINAKTLSIICYQDDINTDHNMKSICAAVAQLTKRLTCNGYTWVQKWKGANILLLEYNTV